MTKLFKVALPTAYETFPLNGVSVGTNGTQPKTDTSVYVNDEGGRPVLSAVNGSNVVCDLGIKNTG